MVTLRKGQKVHTSDRIRTDRCRGKVGWVVRHSDQADEWLVELSNERSVWDEDYSGNVGSSAWWFAPHELLDPDTLEPLFPPRDPIPEPDTSPGGDLGRWRKGYPLPRGVQEAQCPKCSRIFASDEAARRHQKWAGSVLNCLDPATLGLVLIETFKRWVWITPEGAEQRKVAGERMSKARAGRRRHPGGSDF